MNNLTPTISQLRAQVAAIRQKVPGAVQIGIHSKGRWTGDKFHNDGDTLFIIEQCDSPLSFRVALREGYDRGAIRIFLTPLEDKDLGDEILIRLARRRLFFIDNWQIVQSLFAAKTIDPRLLRQPWLAEELLASAIHDLPAVPGGFLDEDTVWRYLLATSIKLEAERPDLFCVLKWSMDEQNIRRFNQARDEFKQGAIAWLSRTAGIVVEPIFRCLAYNEKPDVMAIGLVLGVLCHSEAKIHCEKPLVRLEERYLGGAAPDPDLLNRWVRTAHEAVKFSIQEDKLRQRLLTRMDEILKDVQAEKWAYLSTASPEGFNQRMERFGDIIEKALDQPQKHTSYLEQAQQAYQQITAHEASAKQHRRVGRALMALRLLRWIGTNPEAASMAESNSLAEVALRESTEWSFVDWARLSLRGSEPVGRLSKSYIKLLNEITNRREKQAETFASLIRDWLGAGAQENGVWRIESVMKQLVTPAAAASPVLLIVIDGMSGAVFDELLLDLIHQGWTEIAPDDSCHRPIIAGIPSVTEVSRTSLLSGCYVVGTSVEEVKNFSDQPDLLTACRSGYPPVLYHKPALQAHDDISLAPEVRKDINSTSRKIVGVVINAVDDFLLKGDQLDLTWTIDQFRILPTLLYEARAAGRIVILVSDHGHVQDYRTVLTPHEGGDRWRKAGLPPETGEILLSGNRVAKMDDQNIVVPWSERIRYGMKKNGYHGGVNPQELLVPVTVVCPPEYRPKGWREVSRLVPAWWDETAPAEIRELKLIPATSKTQTGVDSPTSFFDKDWRQATQTNKGDSSKPACWIEELVNTSLFGQQKQFAGRNVPEETLILNFLNCLNQRGGKMTATALARAISYPPFRLRGLMAVMQRLLNVDGYAILSSDELTDTIELNRELLFTQFGISGDVS